MVWKRLTRARFRALLTLALVNMSSPGPALTVFVVHNDDQPVIFHPPRDSYVGDLVDAVVSKLQLGVTSGKVILRFFPGGDGAPGAILSPCDLLSTADVRNDSRLLVEIKPAPDVGAYWQRNFFWLERERDTGWGWGTCWRSCRSFAPFIHFTFCRFVRFVAVAPDSRATFTTPVGGPSNAGEISSVWC